eukprot:s2581_g6.t1
MLWQCWTSLTAFDFDRPFAATPNIFRLNSILEVFIAPINSLQQRLKAPVRAAGTEIAQASIQMHQKKLSGICTGLGVFQCADEKQPHRLRCPDLPPYLDVTLRPFHEEVTKMPGGHH